MREKHNNITGLRHIWRRIFKGGYFYVAILSIILFIVLSLLNSSLSKNENASYYILSSISQGLAALLAFVFTLMLIMLQVFKKYSTWKIIKSKKTIILSGVYCLAVISPLICLRFPISNFALNLCISLAFFCIFSLIPYLYGIGQFISGPLVFGDLEESILSACSIGSWQQAISYLDDFKNIWIELIRANDQNSWDELLTIWGNIRVRQRESTRLFFVFFKITTLVTHFYVKKRNENYAVRVYDSLKLDSNNNFRPQFRPATIDDDNIYTSYVKESLGILETALQNKFNVLSQEIVKTLGNLALRKNDRQIIGELLRIDSTFVENIIRNDSMLTYLGGNRDSHTYLATWLDEIDKVNPKADCESE